MTSEPYKPSEEEIESAILYQKHFDPEHATREDAIAMLQNMHSGFHRMAHDNPEQLLKLQQKVDRKKKADD